MLQFWKNNGTKILGAVIAINSGIAGGSVVLPPPLNTHSVLITAWAVFINFILGIVVVGRGVTNTANAAAGAAALQSMQAAAKTNATTTKSVVGFLVIACALIGSTQLTGCATTPATTQTFNQIAITVGTLADTAVNTANSLAASKTISSNEARAVLAMTNNIEAAVSVANTAYVAGNLPTANAKIAAASAAIVALQACLAEPAAKLDTCIAAIGAP